VEEKSPTPTSDDAPSKSRGYARSSKHRSTIPNTTSVSRCPWERCHMAARNRKDAMRMSSRQQIRELFEMARTKKACL
ncbi:hypothetical protein PFISCL1PPCAC_21907, partial [Pristionchus fissidentatus]